MLSYTNGSLGNLSKHIKRKHPSVVFSRQTPVQKELCATTTNSNSVSDSHLEENSETSQLSSSNAVTAVVPTQPTRSKKSTPGAMLDFVTVTKPMGVNKSKLIDRQIGLMVAKEFHPFSIVEGKEFRKLLNLLNPTYVPPTRKTVSHSLIPQLYNEALQAVRSKLEDAQAVCLTTDGWTSCTNVSFIAVTAHFLSNKNEMISVLLQCVEFQDKHTAENLSHQLKTVVKEWGIDKKIACVVTDNASNVVAAIRLCDWRHISCFAHTLNLVVQSSLEKMRTILVKVKTIVEFFKRSSQALAKLQNMQEQLGLSKLKLIQDVVTRWNSTYDMVERFCSMKDAIVSTVALLESNLAMLTPHEWKVLDKTREVLSIFKEVTEEVSAEKYVSLSKVILFVSAITSDLEGSASEQDMPLEVRDLITDLKQGMSRRFASIEDNDIYTQANLLDPRYKQHSFINEQKYKVAREKLKQKAASIMVSFDGERPPTTGNTTDISEVITEKSPQKRKKKLYEKFDKIVGKTKEGTSKLAAGIIEVDKYMAEELLDRKEDPLLWWNCRKHLYPRLFNLAKKRLCIQATSVPCERLFSKAGEFQNEHRTRLKPAKVSKLLFINHNL